MLVFFIDKKLYLKLISGQLDLQTIYDNVSSSCAPLSLFNFVQGILISGEKFKKRMAFRNRTGVFNFFR
jgi:hypothetical protein